MVINNTYKLFLSFLFVTSFYLPQYVTNAQHRGDDLSFQGLTYEDNLTTKAAAMGGAMTAVSGDLSSLFYNTAGLARIDKFQISVDVNQYSMQWRENQNWFPDRQFTTLPFYLEGLYVPQRQNNGVWDYLLYKDTNYFLSSPLLGKDPYSADAANWKKFKTGAALNNAKIAIPFNVGDNKFVAAVGYLSNNINDYDRNDTYLSPMLTSYDYENFNKVINGVDTLVVNWSRFTRQRSGLMNNLVFGLSNELIDNVMVGVGMKIQFGKSDDYQSLVRIGDFHLVDIQKFKFFFVDSSEVLSGSSKYSSASFNLGTMIQLSVLKIGLKIDLPYTLTRNINYTDVSSGISTETHPVIGQDKVKMPAIYNLGISFQPVDEFLISFNYEYAPYSKAVFSFATPDSSFRQWADQNTFAFGMEYKMYDFLSLMAGYRSIPEVFVPDGAAIKDRGPLDNSYNFGVSISAFLVRIDLAYEYRTLKYYDSYYSNTNYAFESNSTIKLGLSYSY